MPLVIVDEEEEIRKGKQQVEPPRKPKPRKKKHIAEEVTLITPMDKQVDNQIFTRVYDNPTQHKLRIAGIPKRVLDALKLTPGTEISWTLNHGDNQLTLQSEEIKRAPYTTKVIGTDDMPKAFLPKYVLNYFNARRGDTLTWYFNEEQGTVTIRKTRESSKVYAHSTVCGTTETPRGTIPTELLNDLNLYKDDLLAWHVKGRHPDKVHVTLIDRNKKKGGRKYAE